MSPGRGASWTTSTRGFPTTSITARAISLTLVSRPDPMFITRPIAPSHSPAVKMARAVSTT